MSESITDNDLFKIILTKGSLKQDVYQKTLSVFNIIKNVSQKLTKDYQLIEEKPTPVIPFEYKDRGEFEIELRFAGDILIFMMHTNIFEFPRDHEVMRLPYLRDNKDRSYCGIINIYNFLADSFKYNRDNDSGYLIGRIFINKDMHYYLEGKRDIGLIYNNFETSQADIESISNVVKSAIKYTVNFDLLTPPYDNVKEVSVFEIKTELDNMKIPTGKRLGFRFHADIDR